MFSLAKYAFIACDPEKRVWYNTSRESVRIQVSKCCRILMQRVRGTGGKDESVCHEAVRHGHVDCLRAALRFGYQVDESAITEALMHGHVECTDLILRSGFCIEQIELTYSRAILNGHLECVRTLLRHGVPWDGQEVMTAVFNKRAACLQFLLENGCTQFPPSIDMAVARSDVPCAKLLRRYGMPWVETIPAIASAIGNYDLLQYAIVNGCPNPGRYGVRRSARLLERARLRRLNRRSG